MHIGSNGVTRVLIGGGGGGGGGRCVIQKQLISSYATGWF